MARPKILKFLVVAVVAVPIMAAVAAFGFYRDEVTSYVRLQAWNLEPVKHGTREFIEAANRGDGTPIAALISREGTPLNPIEEGGRITGFLIPDYMGAKRRTLRALAPRPDPQYAPPKMVFLEGGAVITTVTFPRSHSLEFRWDRRNGGLKIVDLRWTDEAR